MWKEHFEACSLPTFSLAVAFLIDSDLKNHLWSRGHLLFYMSQSKKVAFHSHKAFTCMFGLCGLTTKYKTCDQCVLCVFSDSRSIIDICCLNEWGSTWGWSKADLMEQLALTDVCSNHSLDVDRVCARMCVSLIDRTEIRRFLPVFQITHTTWQFNVSINMICTSDLCRNGSPWCFLALHCFIKCIDMSHIKRIQNSHPLMDCQRTN